MTDTMSQVREALERALEQTEFGNAKYARQEIQAALAALSRPAPPAEPTFREIRPEEVTFGRHRDVPGAEEVEQIRARAARDAANPGVHSDGRALRSAQAEGDRTTLLRLLDAARAELAEVREAAEVRAWRTSTRAKLPELYWGCEPHGPNKNEHALALWEMLRTALNPVAFPPRAALAKDATT